MVNPDLAGRALLVVSSSYPYPRSPIDKLFTAVGLDPLAWVCQILYHTLPGTEGALLSLVHLEVGAYESRRG
ncbi:hypothetical protein B9Z19DRAFT_1089297 [Tuber borchii]|uniref:Uncharacterized protein n=1 Tax=Tuber borchii TaxID=42251 RepID=A0A2T6ZKH3_TUBBO|nr:hypothetical protein B9Z19DRAFT_1089297 [Tuber borchii]